MRKSSFFLLLALVGFVSIIAGGILLDVTTKPGSGTTWQLVLFVSLAALFPIGLIGDKIFSKRECNNGIHDPNDYGICSKCKKELPLTPEQARKLEERERKYKEQSDNKIMIKLIVTAIVPTILAIVFLFWLLGNSNNLIVDGINHVTLNSTNNMCFSLAQARVYDKSMPFIDKRIIISVDSKWSELDCDHQFIRDQLNNTCEFGEVPKIVDTGILQAQFLCKISIGVIHK